MRRDLSDFISSIHDLSGGIQAILDQGELPDLETWHTFVSQFNSAQLIWWSRYRETVYAAIPSS